MKMGVVNTVHKKTPKIDDGQLEILHSEFSRSQYITRDRRLDIAKRTGLSDYQVMNWFKNRRRRSKERG